MLEFDNVCKSLLPKSKSKITASNSNIKLESRVGGEVSCCHAEFTRQFTLHFHVRVWIHSSSQSGLQPAPPDAAPPSSHHSDTPQKKPAEISDYLCF